MNVIIIGTTITASVLAAVCAAGAGAVCVLDTPREAVRPPTLAEVVASFKDVPDTGPALERPRAAECAPTAETGLCRLSSATIEPYCPPMWRLRKDKTRDRFG